MNDRKYKKSILLALEKAVKDPHIFPGNFISISPEGKISAIPWGTENLNRLLEAILEESQKLLGTLRDNEYLEILKLERELSESRTEVWKLRDKLDAIKDMSYD